MSRHLLCIALLFSANSVQARVAAAEQDPAATRTDVDAVLLLQNPDQLATWLMARSPRVAAAHARSAAAAAGVAQAKVLPNPELALSLGGFPIGNTNPVSPRVGLNQTTYASIGVSELFEIGKRTPRRQAAQARQRAMVLSATSVLADELYDATQAIGTLVFLKAKAAIKTSNLQDAKQSLALADIRRKKQDISENDFERLQLEVYQLEIQLARTSAELDSAQAACAMALYAQCVVGDPPVNLLDTTAVVGTMAAQDRRSDVRALQSSAAAARADAELAAARKIPDLTVGVQYLRDNQTLAGSQPNTLMFSVSLPLPVFDRGRADAMVARALAHDAELTATALVDARTRELRGLGQRKKNLESNLQSQITQATPLSHGIVEQTRQAFSLGQVSLTELILAKRADRDLAEAVLENRYELFVLRTDLRRVAGDNDQLAQQIVGVRL